MPSFSYKAITPIGAAARGTLVARDEVDALEILARKGLTPTKLRSGSAMAQPWWQRDIAFGAPGPARLQPVFAALATLLDARIPLTEALGFVEKQAETPALRLALAALREDLENGRSLTQALSDQPDIFPKRIVTLLATGEASDTLAQTSGRIAAMLRAEAEVASEVRSALVYPAILLVMSILVLALLIFYLVPTLLPIFQTARVAPPPILSGMNSIRLLVTQGGATVLPVIALLALALILARRGLRAALDRALVWTPVVGAFLRKRDSLAFCQSLSVMIEAGMSSVDGLEAAETAVRHAPWQRQVANARRDIEAGTSLTAALDQIEFLAPLARSLIKAGDRTDRLGPMLQAAAKAMQTETQTTLKRAVGLLTPVLTLAIGLVVGVLIVSTISAILDLNDLAF